MLLGIAFLHPTVKRLPITTTIVYLLVGVALSPFWLNLLSVDPFRHSSWLHHTSEVAVLISLFGVGLKLRLSWRDLTLRPAFGLALIAMILTVAFVTATGVWLMDLPLGAAVLLGAALAPTDPVLASDVQLQHPKDRDKIRLTLSVEAGLNDGTAFPLVLLGLGWLHLHDLGVAGWRWFVFDVLWASLGGLAIGAAFGHGIGRLILSLQRKRGSTVAFGEYLVVGLIAVSYGAAVELHAYGFLAVFAAGVALRAVERRATGTTKESDDALDDDGAVRLAENDPRAMPAYLTRALLSTNEQLEHMLEVALVLLVGAALANVGISREALWFSPLLFLLFRPLACAPVLLAERFSRFEFGAVAWFGIRGIGSLYYMMYAVESGLPRELANRLVSLCLTVIALSIVVHGISVTPLLEVYRARQRR